MVQSSDDDYIDDYDDDDYGDDSEKEDNGTSLVGNQSQNEVKLHSSHYGNGEEACSTHNRNLNVNALPRNSTDKEKNNQNFNQCNGNESDLIESPKALLDSTLQNEQKPYPSSKNSNEPGRISSKCSEARMSTDISNGVGDDELRHRLWESSKRLVREGEKNIKLALELEESRNNLKSSQEEVEKIRIALLHEINDGTSEVNKYVHIPLLDLLKIRLQEFEDGFGSTNASSFGSRNIRRKPPHEGNAMKSGRAVIELNKQRTICSSCGANKQAVKDGCKSYGRADEVVSGLQKKVADMVGRSRTERDMRSKLQRELGVANEKVEALSDHIEKLMVHLKHEAISKARALTQRTKTQREVELLKARNEKLSKRNVRKDRTIAELKDGGKILEDQLRLMDEKYMELRIKLDWTRTQTDRVVKRKEEEVRQLRAKFVLVTDLMAESDKKETRGTPLLDYDFGTRETISHSTKHIMKKTKKKQNVIKKLPSTDDGIT